MFSLPQACFPCSFLFNITGTILRAQVICENGWVLKESHAVRNRPPVKLAGSEPWCRLLLSSLMLEETGQPILRGPPKGFHSVSCKGLLGRWLKFAPSWPAWGLIGSLTKQIPKEPSQKLCMNCGFLEVGECGCCRRCGGSGLVLCLWLLWHEHHCVAVFTPTTL